MLKTYSEMQYRTWASITLREHALKQKNPLQRIYYGVMSRLVEATGFPRAVTMGGTIHTTKRLVAGAIQEKGASLGVMARCLSVMGHEVAHANGVHHPSLADPRFWFDVRAAHPIRLTDREGWKEKAVELLASHQEKP